MSLITFPTTKEHQLFEELKARASERNDEYKDDVALRQAVELHLAYLENQVAAIHRGTRRPA